MIDNIKKGILAGLEEIESNVTDIKNIKIEQIESNPQNFYSVEDIEKLAEDIKEHGLLHNLVVRKIGDNKYQLISGERRYRALKMLNYTEVPCKVIEVDDIDAEIMLIQANALARELTDEDKRKQVARLEELLKIKKEKTGLKGSIAKNIGDVIGITDRQVKNYQKINKDLIPELQELFDKKELTINDAIDLSSLNKEQQKQIYKLLSLNIGNIKETIRELQNLIKEKDDELEKVVSEKVKILEEKKSLEKKINEKEKELERLNNEIDEIKKNLITELEKKNKDAIDQLYKKMEEVDKKKKEIEEENKKLKEELKKINTSNDKEKKNIEVKIKLEYIMTVVKESLKELEKLMNEADDETKNKIKEELIDIFDRLI